MQQDPSLRAQIKAYAADTSGSSAARRLSLSRALAVRSYLSDQGLRTMRFIVRAQGDQVAGGPADRVDISYVNQ